MGQDCDIFKKNSGDAQNSETVATQKPMKAPKRGKIGVFERYDWCIMVHGYQILVTVRGEVPHPRGETSTSVAPVLGSGEPTKVHFIRERGKCCCFGGVLGCCVVFSVAIMVDVCLY